MTLLSLCLAAIATTAAALALHRRHRTGSLSWPVKQSYFAMVRRARQYFILHGWTLRDVPVPVGLFVVAKTGPGDCIVKCNIVDPDTRELALRDFEALPAFRGKAHTRLLITTDTVSEDLFRLGLTRGIFLLHYKALHQVVRLCASSVDEFQAELKNIGNPVPVSDPRQYKTATVARTLSATTNVQGLSQETGSAAQTDAQREMIQRLLAEARACLPGDPAGAMAAFRKVIAQDTGHLGALASLSDLLAKAKSADEALTLLRHAISVAPKNPVLRIQLGHLYSRQNAWEHAEDAFRQALMLKPADPAAQNGLVLALTRQLKIEDAVVEADLALETSRGDVGLLAKLGQLRLIQKNHEAAASLFHAVLAIDACHIGALGGLATAYSLAGQNEAAVTAIRRAVLQLPRDVHLHIRLGQLLMKNGQSDQACLAFEDALQLDPANSVARESRERLRQEHVH